MSAALAHIPDVPIAAGPLQRQRGGAHAGSRGSPSRRTRIVVAGALLLAGGLAAAIILLTSSRGSAASPGASASTALAKPAGPAPPAVAVTVLNSSPTAGAAATLATALRSQGVNVTTVGNVKETRPPGIEVLYQPGQQAQAHRLARLLATHRPTVAPIDPEAAAAAGPAARLVIVIS